VFFEGGADFVVRQSGNPAGRPRKAIGDLSASARKYSQLALQTIVDICLYANADRDRLTAAKELLDRGFGKSLQPIDMLLMGKKLAELSTDELLTLNARLISAAPIVDVTPEPVQEPPGEEKLN
jgi:hypothetical protein